MKFLRHLIFLVFFSALLISCTQPFASDDGTDADTATDTMAVTEIETGEKAPIASTGESESESENATIDASRDWPGGTFLYVRQAPAVIALGELNAELGVEELGNDANKLLYDVEVVVTDPEIVEIVSVDKYAIFDCGKGDVVLRGLKEGSTTLILKHIYKATGAYRETSIPLTVEDLAENEDETTAVVDTSDVWEVFFTRTGFNRVYAVEEGEIFDRFLVEFRCVDCNCLWHATNCPNYGVGFNYEDYSFDVVALRDGVVEILSCEKYAIMNTCQMGGIVVRGLREGTTTLQLTMTHIPTSKTATVEAAVVVVASAETNSIFGTYDIGGERYEDWCVGAPQYETYHDFEGHLNTEFVLANPIFTLRTGLVNSNGIGFYTLVIPDDDEKLSDFVAEFSTSDSDVIEIVSVDYEQFWRRSGTVSIKALSSGVAHIYITITHSPTGKSSTLQQVVIVRNSAE